VLQRVQRMLNAGDQERYAEAFAPYLKGHAGQYVYQMKREEIGEALQQILERTRGCRIVGDSRENVVQNCEESKAEYRRVEEEPELPCGSPGVDECKDKGSSCKKG